jgi:uncharacterized protein YdeI (YjbR/CyaY-like superfamily)
MNRLMFNTRAEFRIWLAENVNSIEGVWLLFYKDDQSSLSANDALEEALSYGWIDGQIQNVDEKSYVKYFKQRSPDSNWSEKNRRLADKLESDGLMTDFGRAKIEIARKNGHWNPPKSDPLTAEQLKEFEEMLKPHTAAYENYKKMPNSARRAYTASYYLGTKTETGRQKRFDTVVERLELNLNPVESMKKKLDKSCE